uniref:Uncharacterized protein n=1 Tax=Rhizophora mucronata TaxID=61149 RepID=A0A2P2ILH9_RHIMU
MYERTEQQNGEEVQEFMQGLAETQIQRLLKEGQEGAQTVEQRAISGLPSRKHIKFLSQTAILEFKCGLPNRGQSFFEGIL